MSAHQLVYREIAPDRGAPEILVIGLHDRVGATSQLESFVRACWPQAVASLPQAARPCNPAMSGACSAAAYSGFSWFLGDDPLVPEPASFGDALAQADGFVRERRSVHAGLPCVLVGRGQGAALAIATATVARECLDGVVLLGGGWPQIDGWPPEGVRGLRLLHVQPVGHRTAIPAGIGAQVETAEVPESALDSVLVRDAVRRWSASLEVNAEQVSTVQRASWR